MWGVLGWGRDTWARGRAGRCEGVVWWWFFFLCGLFFFCFGLGVLAVDEIFLVLLNEQREVFLVLPSLSISIPLKHPDTAHGSMNSIKKTESDSGSPCSHALFSQNTLPLSNLLEHIIEAHGGMESDKPTEIASRLPPPRILPSQTSLPDDPLPHHHRTLAFDVDRQRGSPRYAVEQCWRPRVGRLSQAVGPGPLSVSTVEREEEMLRGTWLSRKSGSGSRCRFCDNGWVISPVRGL